MAQNFKYSFDKSCVLSKITDYCKANKLKISDFEKNIGVSKGYLSRLGNATRDVSPSIDVVCKMADAIKVTPEELINSEATSLSKTELYIEGFFQKLLRRTCNNKTMWIPELPSALPINGFDISVMYYDHFSHGLLQSIRDDEGATIDEEYIGKLDNCKQTIVDLILHTEFAEKQSLYIVPMKWEFESGENEIGFDIFLNRNLICSTRNITGILEHSVVSLYEAAKRSLSKHFLKEEAKAIFEEISAKYSSDEETDDETVETPIHENNTEEFELNMMDSIDCDGNDSISDEDICDYYEDSMSDAELFNDYDEDGTGLDLWAKHGMD